MAAAVVLLAGCASARHYPPPTLLSGTRLVTIEEGGPCGSLRQAPPLAPRNCLVLSGGGMNGAYTAGVLRGWTDSGQRPPFDVVTGISTGALIATFAFLGSEYDAELARLYTSMRREDIFRPRLVCLDSVASSEPLEQRIAASATPEILRQTAAAHRQGRRLYAGTTNLDTKRLVVWDLGAIAARDSAESRDLFRKVLLASCSIPGLLPPVPIDIEIDGKPYTELHVDGGVAASVFLHPAMVGIQEIADVPPSATGSNIWVIVAGKGEPDAVPAKTGLLQITGESLNGVLQTRLEGDLLRVFLLAKYAGAEFHLAAVRQGRPAEANSMSFGPEVMRSLFNEGRRGGRDGTAWRSVPPGIEESRVLSSRSGVKFAAIHDTAPVSWPPDTEIIRGGRQTE
jgi:predicted patatin/cPLA2 family phospholipase